MRLIHIVLSELVWLGLCQAIDFCEIKACKEVPHIGCHNDMNFNSRCLRTHFLIKIRPFTEYLIKIHNKYRQNVAAGEIRQLPTAAHMPELVWDADLALVAEYHVKQCQTALTDYCVATNDFEAPKANVGAVFESRIRGYSSTNTEYISIFAEQWLHQVYSITSGDIHEYVRQEYSHIMTILNEKVSHFGCAAAQDFNLKHTRFLLICYYSSAPTLGTIVYTTGNFTPADCENGPSTDHPNLCKTLPKSA
ncbi:venom allergen 3 homolog [Scaptodrosophila lebanonensis]|uniref:Venom allergen 3 homolog n=1 Tax=Drosophila lebanonensis TaxID=7225 RepID=A0A6J2TC49_DROLE|nr:venom allergen 3 homolog [Scaptodrosophila lebanonensis]